MKSFTRVGSLILLPVVLFSLAACSPDDGEGGGIQEIETPADDQDDIDDSPEETDGSETEPVEPNDDEDVDDTSEQDGADSDDESGSSSNADDEGPLAVDETPDTADQIDEQLVQSVIDQLDPDIEQFYVNVANEDDGEEVMAELALLYTDPALGQRIAQLNNPEFAAVLNDSPGQISSEVQELRTVELECVDVIVERDMTEINSATSPGEQWAITLVPASDTENGTAWQIARELPPEGGESVSDDACGDILS